MSWRVYVLAASPAGHPLLGQAAAMSEQVADRDLM